ncbi:MAG: SET domain-containing protein, partial [Flavisolibacter sp.]
PYLHRFLNNMALLEKQLVVKRSTLPNAGKGLFTKKTIPKDTRIVEYKGRVRTWKEAAHEDNGYIYHVTRNHVIDAKPYPKALARYANDARGLERVKGIVNNSDYIQDGKNVYITSKREIPAGSEILVGYGKEYWDVIRHNIKIDKAKQKEAGKKKTGQKKVKARSKKSR